MIRRWLTAAVLLMLLVPVGGWFWLGSDSGRQWLAAKVAAASDGSVEISGLTGHPLLQLHADLLLFRDATMAATIESVYLAWAPWRLWRGELAVDALNADRVAVRLLEGAPADPSAAPVSLPVAAVTLGSLRIGELIVTAADGTAERISDIRLQGLLLSESLAGRLQARHADGDLSLRLSGSLQGWALAGELERVGRGTVAGSLSGQYLRQGEAKLEIGSAAASGRLQARWQRQEGALAAQGELRLLAGGGELAGSWQFATPADLSRLQFDLQGLLSSQARLARPMSLVASAKLEDGQWSGRVEEEGRGLTLAWQFADGRVEGDLRLEGWDSPLKEAAGRLSGSLRGSWRLADQQWQLAGDIDRGELAGMVASLKLDGQGEAGSWVLHRADIMALGVEMRLAGRGDLQRLRVAGDLFSKDLAAAMKFAGLGEGGGRLQARIRLAGSYGAPEAELSAQLYGLRLQSLAMDGANLTVRHRPDEGDYRLAAADISLAGQKEVERLDAHARLRGDALTFEFATEGRLLARARVAASVEGAGHIRGVASDLQLSRAGLSLLQADRLPFRVEGDRVQLARSTVRLLGARAIFNLDLAADSVSGRLEIPEFKVTGNESWLKEAPYRFAGRASLSLALSGHPASPSASARVTAPAWRLRHARFKGEAGRMLALSDVALQLDYGDRLLRWQFKASAPAQTVLESSGRMALLFSLRPWQMELPDRQQGSGRLSARLGQLSELQPLLLRLDPVEGSGSLDLEWAMPLTVSVLKGDGNLRFDSLGIPEFGLEMQGGFKARLKKGRPFVDLQLRNGDGELAVRGLVDVENRTIPDIRFNRFPLMQLPDQQLAVSGRIALSERQEISNIEGELEVVQLRLEIPDPVPGATEDLEWQEDGEQPEQRAKTPLSRLNIDLKIGDQADIYGRGMSLRPKGRLHLGGSLTEPKLTGLLEITSGKIEFRSIRLDILAGSRVLFSGDPKRPAIHVRAARKVGDVTAGVLVEGPVDQLSSSLFSEPAMTDAEILSYIATGRPLASLGKDRAGDMMTAAEFILGPGTMLQEVQGKVQQATGLDIFELGGDASGGRVRAGRKLSDEMTLTVEQTVSRESSTALTLEYMFSRSLSLFARQAMNMAPRMGLRYSKEWFGSAELKE